MRSRTNGSGFYSLLRESGSVTPRLLEVLGSPVLLLFAVTRERVSDCSLSRGGSPSRGFYSLLRESGSVTSVSARWKSRCEQVSIRCYARAGQ